MLLGHSRDAAGLRHLVLIPDEDLQEFPWEALPVLTDRSVCIARRKGPEGEGERGRVDGKKRRHGAMPNSFDERMGP